jgi:hypothetical protein
MQYGNGNGVAKMAIDAATDDLISINEVCKKFPGKSGKPRALNTVIRWIVVGSISRHGSAPVKLAALRVGGNWYTTHEAIREFSNSLTAQAGVIPAPTALGIDSRRNRALARLKAKGVCK